MKEKLRNILIECGIGATQVDCENYLREELLDSMIMAEIIFTIEDKFEIEIDVEDIVPECFENINTIMQLIIKNGG